MFNPFKILKSDSCREYITQYLRNSRIYITQVEMYIKPWLLLLASNQPSLKSTHLVSEMSVNRTAATRDAVCTLNRGFCGTLCSCMIKMFDPIREKIQKTANLENLVFLRGALFDMHETLDTTLSCDFYDAPIFMPTTPIPFGAVPEGVFILQTQCFARITNICDMLRHVGDLSAQRCPGVRWMRVAQILSQIFDDIVEL